MIPQFDLKKEYSLIKDEIETELKIFVYATY